MSTTKTSIKQELVDCLTQQISEIELLKSMYPNPGDIILSTKNIAEINNFINSDSKSEYVPNNLDFVINLFIQNYLKLELFINLPLSYPNEEPDIYIRCNELNRQQETSLNIDLMEFIKTKHIGEVCLYTAITWLQDNIDMYATKHEITLESVSEELQIKEKFSRYWIYSHHIYNKKKREDILKVTKELGLTGFCLPGKPGVICVEGNNQVCNEWWKNIKSMCWKKISIRNTEDFELSEETKHRRFNNFVELNFKSTTNNKHSNMSEFSKYMNNLGFGQIFSDFFRLENE